MTAPHQTYETLRSALAVALKDDLIDVGTYQTLLDGLAAMWTHFRAIVFLARQARTRPRNPSGNLPGGFPPTPPTGNGDLDHQRFDLLTIPAGPPPDEEPQADEGKLYQRLATAHEQTN